MSPPYCSSHNPSLNRARVPGYIISNQTTCLSHGQDSAPDGRTVLIGSCEALVKALKILADYKGWSETQQHAIDAEIDALRCSDLERDSRLKMFFTVIQAAESSTIKGSKAIDDIERLWKDVKRSYPKVKDVYCNDYHVVMRRSDFTIDTRPGPEMEGPTEESILIDQVIVLRVGPFLIPLEWLTGYVFLDARCIIWLDPFYFILCPTVCEADASGVK